MAPHDAPTERPDDPYRHDTTGPAVKRAEHVWTEAEKKPYSCAAPQSYDELDFEPQPMVGWYRPTELAKAGVEAVVSATFGSYADKREVQSVLTKGAWHDYSGLIEENGEVWIDYVADLGDGWDSTYTVARLLAEEELWFDPITQAALALNDRHDDAQDLRIPTQRGRVLVMGGDQVYPTASPEEYSNRMVHPYRCALPFVSDCHRAPHLYLIPGNHDWYDGLNTFFKLFCQHGWVGGWKTWQRRSYFALKLDERLWLWGIDIQLNAYIDKPQLDYFEHVAAEVMEEGSRIILCTAEPSWVYVDAKTSQEKNAARRTKRKDDIYNNLAQIEKKMKPHGHEVVVGLAGDWHNYTRYEAADGTRHQRFVSGGGGAYLYPTHNMIDELTFASRRGGPTYKREAIFPSEDASKGLANRSLLFPFFRLNGGFTFFLGAFYLLLAWIVQSVSKVAAGDTPGATLLDRFKEAFDLTAFIEVIAHSPGSVVFLLVLVVGLIAFSPYESLWKKIVHGGVHGLAHVALFLGLLYLFAQVNLDMLDLMVDNPLQVVLFGVEMLVFGGFLGGVVFGLYLWVSNRYLKLHDNEVLLCQSNPDYKNFLRLHIKDGTLTIYPIGVTRVNRKRSWSTNRFKRRLAAWALQPNATGGAAWFEPKNSSIQSFAHLIEPPITVPLRDASKIENG